MKDVDQRILGCRSARVQARFASGMMVGRDDTTKPARGNERADTHARIVALWEGGSSTYWLPPGSGISVGRASECELVVDDASVSRKHAVLNFNSTLAIQDLGSANGVRVRGARIAPHVRTDIGVGDVVELGSTVLVVVPPTGTPTSVPRPTVEPLVQQRRGTAMEAVDRLITLLAKSDLSVMILGETGVGKNVAADQLHHGSKRAEKPFVKINCAAVPESLLESELFGYERGAFTGAHRTKPGLIESADGGTLLLDEIGEMPLATQAKLLTVMESRELLRLGSLKPIVVDVRFLGSTNRQLEQLVQSGAFRADLFYRLNGAMIVIPPLRERVDEIPELVTGFVRHACQRADRPPLSVAPDAMAALVSYNWPGNIRELKNAVERAIALCTDQRAERDHFFPQLDAPLSAPPSAESVYSRRESQLLGELDALEKERVLAALESCHGNQTQAAKLLGISRRTLIARIESYGLPRPRKR